MKKYSLSLIKNLKCGLITIPFGMVTLFVDFITIINTDFIQWQTILLLITINLIGLPGILIHIYYLLHDLSLEIIYNPKNDYFEFVSKGKTTKIYKEDIGSLDKITKDGLIGKIPWGAYKMFQIRLKKGEIYSITNLSIDFEELYQITKTKDRQINIYCKFKLF